MILIVIKVVSHKSHDVSYGRQIDINRWNHDDVIKWKPFSALLAVCAGISPVTGEFSPQRLVTRSFDVSFDLRLNKRLMSKNNREVGDLRRYRAHDDVTVM